MLKRKNIAQSEALHDGIPRDLAPRFKHLSNVTKDRIKQHTLLATNHRSNMHESVRAWLEKRGI